MKYSIQGFHNPQTTILNLIESKKSKISTIDKRKYERFIQQTLDEIATLQEAYDSIAHLHDIDILAEIQDVINHSRAEDIEVLQINIPLKPIKNKQKRALVDFTERGQHE